MKLTAGLIITLLFCSNAYGDPVEEMSIHQLKTVTAQKAEYWYYNSFRSVTNINGPIVDEKLYLGEAFQYRTSDGYVQNQSNGDDRAADLKHMSGRATVRRTPSDL